MRKVYVIGMDGAGDISARGRELLTRISVIYASRRLRDEMSAFGHADAASRARVVDDVRETASIVKGIAEDCAVIASGDPSFYGIGARLLDALPREEVVIIPAMSSIQLACAAAGVTWHDAMFVSLHGGLRREWDAEDLPLLLIRNRKLVILTGGKNPAASIAAHLPGDALVCVCERMGAAGEKVISGPAAEMAGREFREPNVMIVTAPESGEPVFGLTEDQFIKERDLITKDEVRAVALHMLALPPAGVMWDVGAGSGSVAIEARRLSPGMRAYAVEKSPSRAADIKANARALNAGTINVIEDVAPDALADLPAPDRVFIGGGGADLRAIITASARAMKPGGVIVAAAVTLESINAASEAMKALGLDARVVSVAASRSEPLGGRTFMRAENTVYLIRGAR